MAPLELIHIESGVALLELPEGPRNVRLAVPPGVYLVRKKFPESILTKEVAIKAGTSTTIDEGQLTLVGNQQLVAKSLQLAPPPPEPAEASGRAPGWAKLGAVSFLTAGVLSFALGYKFALDIQGIHRDLDPYRRYPCRDNPNVNCDKNGTAMLRPVTPDEIRYVVELQDEGKRYESYQYKALGVGAGFALLSIPFFVKWMKSGNPEPSIETSWLLTPTWGRGPGFSVAARF